MMIFLPLAIAVTIYVTGYIHGRQREMRRTQLLMDLRANRKYQPQAGVQSGGQQEQADANSTAAINRGGAIHL